MVMLMQQACLKNLKSDMDPGVIVSLMIGAEQMCDADCCHYFCIHIEYTSIAHLLVPVYFHCIFLLHEIIANQDALSDKVYMFHASRHLWSCFFETSGPGPKMYLQICCR